MGTKQTNLLNNSELATWFWEDMYHPEITESELQEVFSKEERIIQIQNNLQYQFQDISFLIKALSHRSFTHEVKNFTLRSYESLEFLGDSFLNYFVSKKLKEKLGHLNEGQWSKMRGAIVNTVSLHDMAIFFKLDNLLLTGRGQVTHQETLKHKIYADIFESIVGAIICDRDEVAAWNFLETSFHNYQEETGLEFWAEELLAQFDFKSQLQEIVMAELKTTPIYEAEEVSGGFEIVCKVGGEVLGSLEHHSKKIGQKELAKKILNNKEELLMQLQKEKRHA